MQDSSIEESFVDREFTWKFQVLEQFFGRNF